MAPPAHSGGRFAYGLVQPVVGARVLLGDRALLRAALVPAALLAAVCAAVALAHARSETAGEMLRTFYTTFAVLAPVPSVLLAHHYARLAVLARHKLGFSPAEPCLEPLGRMLARAVAQTILIAVAVAPPVAVLRLVPGVGHALVKVVAAGWALHWIVVDAFDSARFLRPGQTLADLDAHAETIRPPWYVRALRGAAARAPLGRRVLAKFADACDRLSKPWREEIALVEDHPSLMLGFALSTAALLALPVVNLLFRPIVLVAAAHVLGQLEAIEPESPAVPPVTVG
ncbi:MAG TPA: hypothetical protein VKE22_04055 [Haliangiales bacterium]|nr:hypothetical protein [Haliangiales bacterium]